MGAIHILLGTAIVNANHALWYQTMMVFQHCFFRGKFGDVQLRYNYVMIIVLLTFLFSSYIMGVIKLFEPLSRKTQKWLGTTPGNLVKRSLCYTANR